ncbi:hypothetical protein BSZ39_09775 [Bowdeniella nasicola]|uniref:PadR family transcriptional regulator n=1 Tax=Bowdeniella nasicola TaxID=208480 RepID=A0A1Q5Q0V9_9ACTO|nr:helix-turn-helix transcriptional regulator [Bowdeniella nasicola]OKL53396.1 hypothetical protein BSZ39_09775 [Bowdeniella nasicola]
MAIKHGLLALLAEQPLGAYALRKEFESRTGQAWPVNIGQVSATLTRLQRDGLIEVVGGEAGAEGRGDIDLYSATEAGRAFLAEWWAEPVDRARLERDEFTIKLVLAVFHPDADANAILANQRVATMAVLHDVTRMRGHATKDGDHGWEMVMTRQLFDLEAELKWLDHVAGSLAKIPKRSPQRATVKKNVEQMS